MNTGWIAAVFLLICLVFIFFGDSPNNGDE